MHCWTSHSFYNFLSYHDSLNCDTFDAHEEKMAQIGSSCCTPKRSVYWNLIFAEKDSAFAAQSKI